MTFLKFCLVGVTGFLVDATVFFLSVHLLGSGWAAARVTAFLVAVSVTWLGNRRMTFASNAPLHREGSRYLLAQTVGCLMNYLAFVGCVETLGTDRWLVFPYLVGTAAGLAFNYSMARYFVFQTR